MSPFNTLALVILGAALTVSQAAARTVIYYGDGSTYTLEANEQIYISTPHSVLFKRQLFSNKRHFFPRPGALGWTGSCPRSDDGQDIGSHQWCQAFLPWSEGMTFNQQAWDRHCDTAAMAFMGRGMMARRMMPGGCC